MMKRYNCSFSSEVKYCRSRNEHWMFNVWLNLNHTNILWDEINLFLVYYYVFKSKNKVGENKHENDCLLQHSPPTRGVMPCGGRLINLINRLLFMNRLLFKNPSKYWFLLIKTAITSATSYIYILPIASSCHQKWRMWTFC